MKSVVCSFAAVALFAAAPAHAQAVYQLTDVGMLPGCATSAPQGISQAGEVVGSCGSDQSFVGQTGWTYQGGTLAPLGKLPGGTYSGGLAANNFGVVVGDGDTGNFRPQAVLFRGGQVINIDPVSGGNAYAMGITDAGVIYGVLTSSLSGNTSSWRVVMWTEDPSHPGRFRRTQLPMPTGGSTKSTGVFAFRSSNTGFVAGYAVNDVIGQQGALWNNDAAHTLSVLYGLGGMSIAQDVNDSGFVAGYSQGPAGMRAVTWSSDALHSVSDLGVLPGDTDSWSTGVNNLGQVVGISSSAAGRQGFLYSNGQMVPLASLLDASAAGWTIDQPVAINDAGQIAGSGLVNGQRHGFVLNRIQ